MPSRSLLLLTRVSFRFVLDSRGNYVGNLLDPDIFVNWENVAQVVCPRKRLTADCAIFKTTSMSHLSIARVMSQNDKMRPHLLLALYPTLSPVI